MKSSRKSCWFLSGIQWYTASVAHGQGGLRPSNKLTNTTKQPPAMSQQINPNLPEALLCLHKGIMLWAFSFLHQCSGAFWPRPHPHLQQNCLSREHYTGGAEQAVGPVRKEIRQSKTHCQALIFSLAPLYWSGIMLKTVLDSFSLLSLGLPNALQKVKWIPNYRKKNEKEIHRH